MGCDFYFRTLVILAFASLFASPSALADDECAQLPKPSVTVKRLDEPAIRYSTEYGYRTLTSLGGEKVKPGSQVLGLTRVQSIARFALETPGFQDATRRYECTSPQITLTLGLRQLAVYVGKEFPVGTCAYKEILDHEMRHVKTYQEHIAVVEKLMQEDISRRFATGGIWRGEAGTSLKQISRELNERWLPYVNRELGKVELAQALIDAPEEYARLSEACDGEIRKLAASPAPQSNKVAAR